MIPLAPMDYYFFRRNLYTIQYIFEYKGHLDLRSFDIALQRTILSFPAVSARMRFVSDREIILEPGPPINVRSFSSRREIEFHSTEKNENLVQSIQNAEGEPLLAVKVTMTPTKTFIGFSFSHMLGDGKSIFHFLSELSRVCSGGTVINKPCDDRGKLIRGSGNYLGHAQAELFRTAGYVMPKPATAVNAHLEKIHYSKNKLDALQAKLVGRGISISKNDIVMADLAKRFHSFVPLHEGKFIIRCPVDYRRTLGLSETYFGNAIRDAVAAFDPAALKEMKIEEIALGIRRAINSVDGESVQQSLQCLYALREEKGFGVFEDVGCPGLIVTNCTKFPISKMDFGIGPPNKFHQASINPRLAILLPSMDGLEVRFNRPI